MTDVTEKMRKNAETYRERVEEIRRDWTRSDEAKRQDLAAAYAEASSAHKTLEDEYRTGVRDRLRNARKKAFAPPVIPGSDKALVALAYRDALDRASRFREPRQLSDLLARAEITGDHALARAVLYRGFELENEGLVHSYFENYPDELQSWDAFMAAAAEHNRLETLGISGAEGVPETERPREVDRQFAVTSQGAPGGEGA
jgi:hypothetical protein